nr:coat protein [Curvularia lunata partitivirus 1]
MATTRSKVIESKLEEEFLKESNLDSLDELKPQNFPELSEPKAQKKVTVQTSSAAPVPAPELKKTAADAKSGSMPEHASDVLEPFIGTRITYASRKKLSSFWPSALMMDYLVHLINLQLVDHFYFKRFCPDYHPYIFRLYCAILFYIQCLRAGLEVKAIPDDQHQFVVQFLEAFPPAKLPIPGPLIVLFKSICASQPEVPQYGKVYPKVPTHPGPILRSSFRNPDLISFVQPNVPGIFALLEDLNNLINGDTPVIPKKGKHIPVNGKSRTFGHHSFPEDKDRSEDDKWSLVSSGLQYPCEADSKLNESFAERYDNFDFPPTAAKDNISSINTFLSMDKSKSWFAQVRDVADAVAAHMHGSGTLADCSPVGIVSNQILVQYLAPSVPPTPPAQSADKRMLFPFGFKLSTTMRSPPALAEAIAAYAQTNIRMFPTHPYAGDFGSAAYLAGSFWNIRPIEKSPSDEESYLSLTEIVKKMIKPRL